MSFNNSISDINVIFRRELIFLKEDKDKIVCKEKKNTLLLSRIHHHVADLLFDFHTSIYIFEWVLHIKTKFSNKLGSTPLGMYRKLIKYHQEGS